MLRAYPACIIITELCPKQSGYATNSKRGLEESPHVHTSLMARVFTQVVGFMDSLLLMPEGIQTTQGHSSPLLLKLNRGIDASSQSVVKPVSWEVGEVILNFTVWARQLAG